MCTLVSRISTIFYVESVLKIFASFTVIKYVSNMYECIYLDQSWQKSPERSHRRIWYKFYLRSRPFA